MSAQTQTPTQTLPTQAAPPSLLRLATAGSVDDGKSTLVGRLLHDTKSVLADQMAAVQAASKRRGWTGELADLALLTDGLRAEREQGITIDVAYRYFATPRRSFVLADCPGHVQYTRNTVTGASTADVVVVLVDARHGVVEQTRRHLAVVGLLRVPHVVVALNKIDLVPDEHGAQSVYASVTDALTELADVLELPDITVVPLSALRGDNVVERSASTPWYSGPTLLELLESLPAESETDEPLRFPVQLVIRPQQGAVDPAFVDYRGYAGHVASGIVRVGDQVVVTPSGQRTSVVGIDRAGDSVLEASAPLSVTLRLADQVDISRGDLIAAQSKAPPAVTTVEAVLCWLAETPLTPGARVLVKHGTRTVRARISAINERLDIGSLTVEPASAAGLNDLVRVSVVLSEALPVEDYTASREGGSFLVIDPHDGATLGAGMVGAQLVQPGALNRAAEGAVVGGAVVGGAVVDGAVVDGAADGAVDGAVNGDWS